MSDKKHNKGGVIFGLVGSLAIFIFAGWLLFNRQYAADQVRVKARDRMQVIEMKATQEALPIVAPEVVSDTPVAQVAPVVEKKA